MSKLIKNNLLLDNLIVDELFKLDTQLTRDYWAMLHDLIVEKLESTQTIIEDQFELEHLDQIL